MPRRSKTDDKAGPEGADRVIGPAGDGPIGSAAPPRRRRRSPAGRLLLTAWLLLIGLLLGGGGYVFWPEIEATAARQLAALTGGPGPEEAPVEVAERPVVPSQDAAPGEAPDETVPDETVSGASTPGASTPGAPIPGAPIPEDSAAEGPRPGAGELTLDAPQAAPLDAVPLPESGAPPDAAADSAGAARESTEAPQTAALPPDPDAATAPAAPAPPEMPAWKRFAMPFAPPPERPLIAVVITDLGLNGPRTLQAIEELPPEISLSFSPYGKQVEQFMRTARAFGHEVLLDLPMEPATRDDPGSLALRSGVGARVNLDRLDLVLTRGRGYVGVVGALGSRFVIHDEALEPVLRELGRQGLLYLDNRPLDRPHAALQAAALGLPVAVNDRSLDARMAATPAVEAGLAQIERIARERGTAVALGRPNPTTLERLAAWVQTLPGKGLALAPITAVADSQPLPREVEPQPEGRPATAERSGDGE